MRSEERDAEIPTPGTAPAQELTHEIVSVQEETPGTAPVQGATSGVTSAQDEVSHSASGRASDLRPNNAGAKTASNPPTVEEWISTLDDDRAEILTCLFSGGRVATLAKARDISLTEARKLKKDALAGRPVLFEDRYRYLFRTYRMSSVTLKQLTGLGRLSYGYLMFLYSPGYRPLRPDALQDICVPQEIRDKLSEKNEETRHTPLGMVRVDGEYISRNRTSLLIKYGKQYAAKPMGASSFRLGYNEFLSRLSLGMGPDMSLPSSLAGFTYCLERTGSYLVISKDHVRYRPYSEYDYRALRELLGTYVSRNIECSTELLFREHPDLMKDLDILDAQELHVVIKRLLDEEDIEGVHLEKRPVIRFGEGDRKRQAIELIKEMGPSSVDEVAAEYESRFGNSPSFFKTAVKREISAYCKNGRFEYRETDMSAEQREYLLSLLDKDYQALDLVKAQFSVRFPDMNELDVNDEVLSELGYHVDCGLVVRDGVELGPVFSRLVRQKESFSIRDPDFGPAVLSHPEFRKVLNRGLNSLEIVEISKDEFVLVKKLKRIFGVTRADLLDYANEAGKTAQHEAPFTIHSLRKEGFVHRIDSLREDAGLGDCMYESLIALLPQSYGIKRTAMGGTMVFCKLNHKFSAVDFLELIVKSEERIELDELIDLLLDEYGVSVPESTLRLAIDRAVGEGRLFFNQSFQMLLPSKEANLEFLRGLIDQPKQDQQ